jgi:hypothetical protein
MKGIKLHVVLLDKRNWFDIKANYDPNTRLAEKRNWRNRIMDRFIIDPDHIYEHYLKKRREKAVFVDNATRKSVTVKEAVKIIGEVSSSGAKETTEIRDVTVEAKENVKLHTDDPIDQKQRNTLDFLIERAFWASLLEKRKLPLSTMLILLFAGVGVYHAIVLFLRTMGVQV